MTEFVELLVLGLATGGFYTLNALGVVVVFRSSGIINFASGGAAMVGAYLEWKFADSWGWPAVLAVVVAVALAALVNMGVYLLAIRPLARASTLTQVIATLAVLVSLQQAILLIFGGLPKVPKSFLPDGSTHLGNIKVGTDSLTILTFSILLTAALWAVYRWTRFGLATSALAEDPRALAALGWNLGRLRSANWAVGGALAGLTGAGLGPILQLTPNTFDDLLIPTLAGALIGGLRSFPLTLLGSLVVGAAEAEAGSYIHEQGAASAVPFLIIILVVVLRGQHLPSRGHVHERLPRAGSGEIRVKVLVLAIVAATVLGLVVKQEWVIGATITVMTATVLLSQVVITGYAGQLSLAQLTLAGVGAIIASNLAASFQLPFLLCLAIGMIGVIPVSIAVGLPSLRARGVSLAVASLGFAVAINAVVLTNNSLAGGLSGLVVTPPTIFGFNVDPTAYPRRYFLVVIAVFTVLALIVANVRRGASGRKMLAVRTNERAATALGINVTGVKLYAFTLAGSIAAAGGILLVFSEALPQFSDFDPLTGLSNLVNAVLGGIGFIPGALVGGMFGNDGLPNAILNPVVGNLTWWTEFFPLLVGVIVVFQLVIKPDGVTAVIVGNAADRRSRRLPAFLTKLGAASQQQASAQRRRAGYARELASIDAATVATRGCTLEARGLRVTFGNVVALNDVDMKVIPGQVLSVIGPNGAGKTTLMDALTGFVAASGTIALNGRPIAELPAYIRARDGLARSFQSLELFEDLTVLDNLRCAADAASTRSLFADLVRPARSVMTPSIAAAVLGLGLADALDKLPAEIGYGDRRLVAIARALAGNPAVLLLDEPAAGLSEFERVEVARLITRMAKDWNIAIVLIEHDVELVRRVSDRVIALNFGSVIATGTPDEVLAHPDVIRAYLGSDEPTPAPLDPARIDFPEQPLPQRVGATRGGESRQA